MIALKLILLLRHGVDHFHRDDSSVRLQTSASGEKWLCRCIGNAFSALESKEQRLLPRILVIFNLLSIIRLVPYQDRDLI